MGINRGTVLDLINDVHRAGGFKDYNSYSYLFDQVDTMPESKEDAEPHWIPITDALPQANEEVLITLSFGDIITIGWINKDGEWLIYDGNGNADINDILAWQPLPEPYKGVTE